MSIEGIVTRTKDASKGGFRAVLKIEGDLVGVKRAASPFEPEVGKKERDQVEVTLDNAVILKVEDEEEMPELTDGKFRWWMGYAEKGKEKAHANTFYMKGFLTSAENLVKAEQGKEDGGLEDLMNTRVTLERQDIMLFKRKIQGKEEKEEVFGNNFVFVPTENINSDSFKLTVAKMIDGQNTQAAIRLIIGGDRTKNLPEYREAAKNMTLNELVPVKVVDGVYKLDVS